MPDHKWIAIARGDAPADCVVTGGRVLSVFTGEFLEADLAIADGVIVGVGDYRHAPAITRIDATGCYLTPGLIDGHCHIESTLLTPAEFARTVVPLGTTTVVTDPHETANVLGVPGIQFMLDASAHLPLTVYVMAPSCVPASDHESPHQPLEADDLAVLFTHERLLGLAEVMNFPAVIGADPRMLAKIALTAHRAVDGHAPNVTGRALNAYVVAGVQSDHECTTLAEALEKRRLGMWVMIRQGSTTRNLYDLLPLVQQYGPDRCLFVTDDRTAASLLDEGHMNALVRDAVTWGLTPATALNLASWNVAQRFGLRHLGALAPGYRADFLLLDDLSTFRPRAVYSNGRLVAEHGQALPFATPAIPTSVSGTVHVAPLTTDDLRIPAAGREARVIVAIEGQALTAEIRQCPPVWQGAAVANPAADLAKLAVVERHHGTGRVGLGFVTGFGLRRGAFASTVGHDAHNITVVGVSDADMVLAVRRLSDLGGGLVAVRDGQVLGELALPIAGLMSDQLAPAVAARLACLERVLKEEMGVQIAAPFMTLSFLPLSVIPALKLTDLGLVDVTTFERVSLWV